MRTTDSRRFAHLVTLACASAIIFAAGGAPVDASPVSASISLYGATNDAYLTPSYLFGPVNDSSSTGPVSYSNVPSCYGGCGYSGGLLAFGAAHASPGGDLGVLGDGVAPDGSTYYPYAFPNNAPVVHSNAAFANSAVVRSAINPVTGFAFLAANTPVQLAVTVGLDGIVELGAGDYNKAYSSPGGFTASSNVSGDFQLYDPNVTYSGGEIAGIPITLVNFQAYVSGNDSAYLNGGYVPAQSYDTSWSLTSNHGDNLGDSASYSCDGLIQGQCGMGFGSFTGSPLEFGFSTGLQTVTLDTYIGATLDWSGSIDLLNQAYGATAGSYADFSHTLAVNLSPITSNVALDFSYPQQPLANNNTVPDPPTSTLVGAGFLAAYAIRRRKWRKGSKHVV